MPTSEVSKSPRSSCRSTTPAWGNWYTITRSVVRRRTTLQKVCTLCVSFVLSLDRSLAALTFVARVLRVLRVVSNHVPGALATFHTSSMFSGGPLYFVERQEHECLKPGPSPRAVAPEPTSVDRGSPPRMAAPKLGLDETMELLSRVLGAGDEDPDLSALSAALNTKLGLSDLKKPLPTMSPRVELLTRDVKSCRGIRSSPMDTCPSPFHPRVRTVTVCSVGDTTEADMSVLDARTCIWPSEALVAGAASLWGVAEQCTYTFIYLRHFFVTVSVLKRARRARSVRRTVRPQGQYGGHHVGRAERCCGPMDRSGDNVHDMQNACILC